ncbi:hypothetical protein EV193_10112 [Herbihabitans rhizosphaerae]|uniref:Uncharacterized protein n=1 Tax=Herbihabitans rhizosphaerae TaxID=1872711 RepID=A0A4Q7L3G2_9PSEU|nr:hypothetical protein [Herbihabitans rhizosphaerae]RZS44138.1 hypothetical protein EV193_10112 [Herbihabitans rhizosphaerae]
MDNEHDAFHRIKLTADVQRKHELLAHYRTGMHDLIEQIEDCRYDLGRIDERLGYPEPPRPERRS